MLEIWTCHKYETKFISFNEQKKGMLVTEKSILRERERERERERGCVCVCVRERGREEGKSKHKWGMSLNSEGEKLLHHNSCHDNEPRDMTRKMHYHGHSPTPHSG